MDNPKCWVKILIKNFNPTFTSICKCWVVSTQIWVKYGQFQMLG